MVKLTRTSIRTRDCIESTADSILDQISVTPSHSEREFRLLAESIEFESEDEYREKLKP